MTHASNQPRSIASRLELFTDHHLVESMAGVVHRLHEPRLTPPAQCSPAGHYMTILRDGSAWRAYYRKTDPSYTGPVQDGHPGELTCLALSDDGIEWTLPELGLTEICGAKANNAVLRWPPYSHNFAPFLDGNPAASPAGRCKALAGNHPRAKIPGDGLHAFESPDGLHWTPMHDSAVIRNDGFAFDSQNVAFWSSAEGCYVCYYRAWKTPHGFMRSINRVTSPDFVHWSRPVEMNPNLPGEHLYTSQTQPYFRAPHLYVALPTRFQPERGSSTDILFMTSRAGSERFDRLFTEAFIRPGLDAARWGNRSNYAAAGIHPTGTDGTEISIYHGPAGRRYTLRTDGFISLHAGAEAGVATTHPLTYEGPCLTLNVSTSAAGLVRVEMQGMDGQPLPGRSLDQCDPIYCDRIRHPVTWQGSADVSAWRGKPVRLKLELREADIYAMQFGDFVGNG